MANAALDQRKKEIQGDLTLQAQQNLLISRIVARISENIRDTEAKLLSLNLRLEALETQIKESREMNAATLELTIHKIVRHEIQQHRRPIPRSTPLQSSNFVESLKQKLSQQPNKPS